MFFKKKAKAVEVSAEELTSMAVGFLRDDIEELADARDTMVDMVSVLVSDLEDLSAEMMDKAAACCELRERLHESADTAVKHSRELDEKVAQLKEIINK